MLIGQRTIGREAPRHQKNAAEEKSAGTRTAVPRSGCPPSMAIGAPLVRQLHPEGAEHALV